MKKNPAEVYFKYSVSYIQNRFGTALQLFSRYNFNRHNFFLNLNFQEITMLNYSYYIEVLGSKKYALKNIFK